MTLSPVPRKPNPKLLEFAQDFLAEVESGEITEAVVLALGVEKRIAFVEGVESEESCKDMALDLQGLANDFLEAYRNA